LFGLALEFHEPKHTVATAEGSIYISGHVLQSGNTLTSTATVNDVNILTFAGVWVASLTTFVRELAAGRSTCDFFGIEKILELPGDTIAAAVRTIVICGNLVQHRSGACFCAAAIGKSLWGDKIGSTHLGPLILIDAHIVDNIF
jgi:hypothetical protein